MAQFFKLSPTACNSVRVLPLSSASTTQRSLSRSTDLTETPPPQNSAICGCAAGACRRLAGCRWRACQCAGADRRARGRNGWPCRGSLISPCNGLSLTHRSTPYGTRNLKPLAAMVALSMSSANGAALAEAALGQVVGQSPPVGVAGAGHGDGAPLRLQDGPGRGVAFHSHSGHSGQHIPVCVHPCGGT